MKTMPLENCLCPLAVSRGYLHFPIGGIVGIFCRILK